MNVRFLSVAEVEAAEAALYYDERQAGLGEQFLEELEHALDRIRGNPESQAAAENYVGTYDVRRCLLKRFPYIVVFLVQQDEAVIVAVADARRRPLYWLERLN